MSAGPHPHPRGARGAGPAARSSSPPAPMRALKLIRRQFGGPGAGTVGISSHPSLPARGPEQGAGRAGGRAGPGSELPRPGDPWQRGRPPSPSPADLSPPAGPWPRGAGGAGRPEKPREAHPAGQWPPPGPGAAPRRRLFWESEIKMAEVRPRR